MEEQHPIPQQISSYQFRLVGDMTLKQFFQVAGGAIVSLLIYSSSLPFYIKWPLIIFSFLLGIALAFLPIQDRPLSVWLLSFFKSIYEPTIYTWKKDEQKREYFQPESVIPQPTQVGPAVKTQAPRVILPSPQSKPTPLTPPPIQPPSTPVSKPIFTVGIKPQTQTARPVEEKQVAVPTATPTQVEHTQQEEQKPITQTTEQTGPSTFLSPAIGQKIVGAKEAQFSQDAAPPIPPSKANVIVGQVVGPQGEIVENAILEIKDSEGRSVRALRSNKLGHFMIVTPLVDGKYEIITEKESYLFDPINFEVKGEIIPPIAIRAKSGGVQSAGTISNIYQS